MDWHWEPKAVVDCEREADGQEQCRLRGDPLPHKLHAIQATPNGRASSKDHSGKEAVIAFSFRTWCIDCQDFTEGLYLLAVTPLPSV